MRQIVSSTDLDTWFNPQRRDSQELLPHLVRKLILSTVSEGSLRSIRIPVGDAISVSGYDGRVELIGTHSYVPEGLSAWEMSTGDAGSKAEENYRKRTTQPGDIDPKLASFVYVTPHFWSKKDEWVKSKREEQKWLSVKVWDSIDLAAWLDASPTTARWIARENGVPVQGFVDVDTYCKELAAAYRTPIPDDLIIGGRVELQEATHRWLLGSESELEIEGESMEEIAAFISACIHTLPEQSRDWIEARFSFVQSAEAADYFTGAQSIQILAPLSVEVLRRIAAAGRPQLRRVTMWPRALMESPPGKSVLRLGRIRRVACAKALAGMGISEEHADRIAAESHGSLTAVLWMLGRGPDTQLPWATGEAALDLLPLVLLGQWNEANENDRRIVERITSRQYADIRRILSQWTTPNGPLVRRGDSWDWRAWDFCWRLLAPHLFRDLVTRFIELAGEVLSHADPALELSPDQRWAANVYGKRQPYSPELRTGLVTSVVQFALSDEEVLWGQGQNIADALTRRLLNATDDTRVTRWLSLTSVLENLAEASPTSFLDSLAELLQAPEAIGQIFSEGNIPFGSSPHTNLLWALERLAWSPEWFTRSTLALADLAAVDPGGRLMNRPINSLRGILLPWDPHTLADAGQKLDTIDLIRAKHPQIAWQLVLRLMPADHDVSHPTSLPQWREWKPLERKRPTDVEYRSFVGELFRRLIIWAGNAGENWIPLSELYPVLREEHRDLADQLASALDSLDVQDVPDSQLALLTTALRKMLWWHRDHSEAEWAMGEDDLAPIDRLYERVKPTNLLERHAWLFASTGQGHRKRGLTFEEQTRIQDNERESAIYDIFQTAGMRAVMEFGGMVDRADAVGMALARLCVGDLVEGQWLYQTLQEEPRPTGLSKKLQLGMGYVNCRYAAAGGAWIERVTSKIDHMLSANEIANFAWAMPPCAETWDWIESRDPAAELLYWQRVPMSWFPNPARDIERAISSLLAARRPLRAIDLANLYLRGRKNPQDAGESIMIGKGLLLQALELGLQVPVGEEWFAPRISDLGYDVGMLLDAIESQGTDIQVLAKLEWGWLPLLEHSERGLKALESALGDDAGLFVELLKLVYRAEGEPARDLKDEERGKLRHASQLLERWKRVPGFVGSEQRQEVAVEGGIAFGRGIIDEEKLTAWVHEARRLAKDANRLDICDVHLGSILSYSPADSDGIWPSEPVRNLLEELKSQKLERALSTAVHNRRGVHFRGKGGDQERALARQFHVYYERLRSKYPRTSAVLYGLSTWYDDLARSEDRTDELGEFGAV